MKKSLLLLLGSFFCLTAQAGNLKSITLTTEAPSDPIIYTLKVVGNPNPIWQSTPVSQGQSGPAPASVIRMLEGTQGFVLMTDVITNKTVDCTSGVPFAYIGAMTIKGTIGKNNASCSVTAN